VSLLKVLHERVQVEESEAAARIIPTHILLHGHDVAVEAFDEAIVLALDGGRQDWLEIKVWDG